MNGTVDEVGSDGITRHGKVDAVVTLTLYGESGCPDTADFVVGPLRDALAALGPAVAVDHVPFGNAYYLGGACGGVPAPDPCFGSRSCLYDVTVRECFGERCGRDALASSPTARGECFPVGSEPRCQHGAVECYGNRIQACAVVADADTAYALAACMYGAFLDGALAVGTSSTSRVDGVASSCAAGAGAPWNEIEACVRDATEGDAAVRDMAARTPVHPSVPYVTLDGVPVDLSAAALVDAVCAALPQGGGRPTVCAPKMLGEEVGDWGGGGASFVVFIAVIASFAGWVVGMLRLRRRPGPALLQSLLGRYGSLDHHPPGAGEAED